MLFESVQCLARESKRGMLAAGPTKALFTTTGRVCSSSGRNLASRTSKVLSRKASSISTASPQTHANHDRWQAIKSAKPFSDFLTDNFNRQHDYLRISISERCNLRCLYCMPEEGVELSPPDHVLSTPEIVQIARLFVSQGVTKIRLTGGEPSVRKDFMDLFQQLGAIPGLKELCMTSNGIALPRKLAKLKEYGLTGLNLSLDTLIDGKFQIMTRRKGLSQVLKCLETAIEVGIPSVKINTVVMRGQNEDEILDFIRMTKDMPIEVRFIEYMPFDGNKWSQQKMFTYKEILDTIKSEYPVERVPGKNGDTAKVWTIPGHQGQFGVISSMTSHFCGTCTRLRITSDGNLKVCLFGNAEVSLRDMIRQGATDNELLPIIGKAVKNKKEKHAGIGELENMKNRPMILIGGILKRLSSTLSHVDKSGAARMVDISSKAATNRKATATGVIKFSTPKVSELINANSMKKGDVLSVARIAGIMAVKSTPQIIPLCHPIMITKIQNDLSLEEHDSVRVNCTVHCNGQTGVEMEAITGAMASLVTVYDMCKAVDKHMEIGGVKVVEKQGGSNDFSI